MKCIKCKKTIKANEWFFEVKEYKKKKIIRRDFCHKSCQNEYDKGIQENMISPEQKKKMAEILFKSFKIFNRLQNQTEGLE